MRPNILWIVFDTARADAFEPYGAPAGASPVVADLARRGNALRGVHSTACWTLPAHLSMFTGGLPRQLGLADQAGINPALAKPIVESHADRSIVELLRRSGYATGAVSANAWVTPHSGFGTGFERFVDARSGRQAKMSAASRRARLSWMVEGARARVDDGAGDAERHLHAWIAEDLERPFFWFVNLVECHSPYLPPRSHAELSAVGRVRAAREAGQHLTMEAFWRACVTGNVPDPDVLERMRAGYRGAVRYMDDWLGRLLEALDRAGRLDDTLVILSSDHGENFGEGQLIGHGFSLDQRLVNVPFVVAGPGAETLGGIRSIAEVPGRLATLTALQDHPYDPNGLPPLPVAQFDPPVPPVEDPRTQQAIRDWNLDDPAVERMVLPQLAIVGDGMKLVVRGERESFYDLRSDPREDRPLSAAQVDDEAAAMLRHASRHPAVVASECALSHTSTTQGAPDAVDLEDRMRLLGYL